jgi:hypothetical protein
VGNRTNENRGQLELAGAYNNLNQLTSRDWDGKLDVWGSVSPDSESGWFTNTVNGSISEICNGTNFLGGATMTAGHQTNAVTSSGTQVDSA